MKTKIFYLTIALALVFSQLLVVAPQALAELSGTEVQITTNTDSQFDPRIDGNYIVYTDNRAGNGIDLFTDFNGVWGTSSNDIFAVGNVGTIKHWNGSVWDNMTSNTWANLYDVWGTSSSDVFAVGNDGTIMHWDGSVWDNMIGTTTQFPEGTLYGVWGTSSDDIFFVGENNGIIPHWNGADWNFQNSSTSEDLNSVWGTSSNDILSVGNGGTIEHWNGLFWDNMTSNTWATLYGVWGTSSDDVFAVGSYGTIVRWNGADWDDMTSCTIEHLNCVWGTSSDNVFAVGDNGTILRYNGAVWRGMIGGGYDVYLYNIETGVEFPIVVSAEDEFFNDISGDIVVCTRATLDDDDIFTYNISSGETRQITDLNNQEFAMRRNPAISGNYVVWQDTRYGSFDIYMYDLVTGDETLISTGPGGGPAPGDQWNPAIDGNIVVWEDISNPHDWEIFVYDINTPGVEPWEIPADERFALPEGVTVLQCQPDVNGNYIVFSEASSEYLSNFYIVLWDLETNEAIWQTDDPNIQQRPRIDGNRIVWEDLSDGNLYTYSIATGIEESVTTSPGMQFLPDISRNCIVWTDTRNWSEVNSGNYDIYMFTIENIAPIVIAGADQSGDEGESISVNPAATFTDQDSIGAFTSTIDWGDGTIEDGIIYEDWGSGFVRGTHQYGDNGEYTVSVTVDDGDGGVSSDSFHITVNNVNPTAYVSVTDPCNVGCELGQEIMLPYKDLIFSGVFYDDGWLDTHTATWDFGDGDIVAGSVTEEHIEGIHAHGTTEETHAYEATGVYEVSLTVTDDDGSDYIRTYTLTVITIEEAMEALDSYIQGLSDVYVTPGGKTSFASEFAVADNMIASGNYQGAIDKLQYIRTKVDGSVDGDPIDDWITEEAANFGLGINLCCEFDALTAYLEDNTHVGTDVSVVATDPSTGEPSTVTVIFGEVETPGNTTVTITDTGPELPTSFSLGDPPVYFNIETTAGYDPAAGVTICIDYSGIDFGEGGSPVLLQWVEGEPEPIVLPSWTVDSLICAQTSGFSTFAIAKSTLPQPHIAESWVARYSSGPDKFDAASALAVDDLGNVYVTGKSAGSGANYDYLTVKYNSEDGTKEWDHRFRPGVGSHVPSAIAVGHDGSVYVTGKSEGVGTGWDYATIKLDSNGNLGWYQRYNFHGDGDDYAIAMALDSAGYVYVTGYSTGGGAGYDYLTVKYNSEDGTKEWDHRFRPGKGSHVPSAIAVGHDGSVYVTGKSEGVGTGWDYATIKLDSNGNLLWTKRYDGLGHGDDIATSIALDELDNVFVTGFSTGSGTGYDYATIKYDGATGTQLWAPAVRHDGPGNGHDAALAIAVDDAGNVYVTGQSGGSGTGYDYATIKYDNAGNDLWLASYNGTGNGDDTALDIAVDGFGHAYVTGESEGNGTNDDYATIKYGSDGDELWIARHNGPADDDDAALGIAVDGSLNVYVTGMSIGISTSADYATIKYVQGWTAYTPEGSDVVVDLVDAVVQLGNVTQPGDTKLTTSSEGTLVPTEYKLGEPPTYFDITTTAEYDPEAGVTVCINYSGITFDKPENELRLLHYTDTGWDDITLLPVDTVNKIICGETDNLSWFAIVEPNYPPIARASVDPYLAPVGSDFSFNGSASDDPDGTVVSYEWKFGDGSSGSGASVIYSYAAPGLYDVSLTVTDDTGAQDTDSVLVVVYDAEAGFASGGGWIDSPEGAYVPDPLLTGKANFGFVSKYKKGATGPTGQTEFQFRVADLNFHSDSYAWLVIAGHKAMYKGTGTINGEGPDGESAYKFMLWAVDANLTPDADDSDTFRIRIWVEDEVTQEETTIYDNHSDGEDGTQEIGGGSIVIHK